jgi:hypothetical protein
LMKEERSNSAGKKPLAYPGPKRNSPLPEVDPSAFPA